MISAHDFDGYQNIALITGVVKIKVPFVICLFGGWRTESLGKQPYPELKDQAIGSLNSSSRLLEVRRQWLMPLNFQIFKEISEEPTDWEEDPESCGEDEDDQSGLFTQVGELFPICPAESTFIRPILEQARRVLIESLTKEFWSVLYKHRTKNSVSPIDMVTPNHGEELTLGYNHNLKRGHEEANTPSGFFHVDDGKAHKRLRGEHNISEFSETPKFACPFRKHDPRKYSVPNWGPCALTPLQTVARVKLVYLRPLILHY